MQEFIGKGGRRITNYSAVTLVNNTAKTETITVGAGKRWMFDGATMQNGDSVPRGLTCKVRDASDNELYGITYDAGVAAGSSITIPNTVADAFHSNKIDFVFDAGEKILMIWAAGGASAGGTGYRSLVVREVITG